MVNDRNRGAQLPFKPRAAKSSDEPILTDAAWALNVRIGCITRTTASSLLLPETG